MRGLLLKDWYVAKKACRFHIGIIVLMAVLSLFIDTGMVYLAYPMLFAGMIPVYILSVDEKWAWQRYGQTLPVSRRGMVTAKYLVALISVGGAVVLMAVLWAVKFAVFGGGSGFSALVRTMAMLMCFGMLFPALMLPAMLRFGVEKGRLVMVAAVILAMVLILLLMSSMETAPRGMQTLYVMDIAVRAGWRVPALLAGTLVLLFLSWLIAVRLYEGREL